MEQELQTLKDELARVRAREQRNKSNAEAEIATLKKQLEGMQRAAANDSAAAAGLENRCQQLDAENAALQPRIETLQTQVETLLSAQSYVEGKKSQLEFRCMELEEENTKLEKQLLSSASELEKLKIYSQERENELSYSHSQPLESVPVDAQKLHAQLPGLDDILVTADFLENTKPDIHELLEKEGFGSLNQINTFVCRCSDIKVLVALWKCIHKMVETGANVDVAKNCLNGMLRWYNRSNKNQLKILEQERGPLSIFGAFLPQRAMLLPGLAEVDGYIHVHVLFKSETEPN